MRSFITPIAVLGTNHAMSGVQVLPQDFTQCFGLY
jgi:hypothetical protein